MITFSKIVSTHCAFLVQVEMTSHDVDDDSGPQEYQKYWLGQFYLCAYSETSYSAYSPNGIRVICISQVFVEIVPWLVIIVEPSVLKETFFLGGHFGMFYLLMP